MAREIAATGSRDFRTFLLMAQFEAREIGTRIAQARRESGLTQEQLAEMAPFSKRSLQDYENGVTIPYKHLRDIGKLLDRDIEWFLHGEDEDPPSDMTAVIQLLDTMSSELRRLDEKVDQALAGERGDAGTRAVLAAVELIRRMRLGEQVPAASVERVADALHLAIREYEGLEGDLREAAALARTGT